VIYNEKVTLVENSIVKRTNKGVNEINGYIWDKVILANGEEGYILTENLTIANQEEYSKVSFEYNAFGIYSREYNVYFPTLIYDINMQDYSYYMIVSDNSFKIKILYSTMKFNITEEGKNYRVGNLASVLIIDVENDGRVLVRKNIRLNTSANAILIEKGDFQHNCIAANQEIYYNGNKIFTPYVEVDGIHYRTNINWNDITLTETNYNTIKKGEEEFKSEDDVLLKESLTSDRRILLSTLRITNLIFPQGSTALDYFLTSGNSGKTGYQYSYEEDIYKTKHTMRKIPLDIAIEQSSSMKIQLEENIDTVIKVAEKMNIPENTQIIFSNMTEDSGNATRSANIDWYITLHFYRIKMRCSVIRNGDDYQMSMTYGIVDYYDWETAEPSILGDLLQGAEINLNIENLQTSLNLMHYAGLARNYTNYGETIYNITWNAKDKEKTMQYSINK
ncbi:MAG: hypothetical protein HFJ29_06870, partial [Clostridia bacterium]|nr:hypothetical protein [Clostridia bacterium]